MNFYRKSHPVLKVYYLSIIPDNAETTATSLRETCRIFCISLS